jgi:hypothetical protein
MKAKSKQISPIAPPFSSQGNNNHNRKKRPKTPLKIIDGSFEDALIALSTRPDYTIYEV